MEKDKNTPPFDDQKALDKAPEEQPSATGENSTGMTSSPGLDQVKDAVEFTNMQVLQPDVKPMENTAKLLADQAAAMMIQDARSYLQSNEQVLTIATAKAIAMIMSQIPEEQAAGQKALDAITKLQGTLPKFVGDVGTTATTIVNNF